MPKKSLWMFAVGILIVIAGSGRALPSPTATAVVHVPVMRDDAGIPVPCAEDPVCHNRHHPAIPPVATANPGDTVILETRDAFDNQIGRTTTVAQAFAADRGRVHPLTGPVAINGAHAGDVLEVEIVSVDPGPDQFGWTTVGLLGLLRDQVGPGGLADPFLAHWDLNPAFATSADIPGVAIPARSHPGVIGTTPSAELLGTIRDREFQLLINGGFALPPDPASAVPEAVCGVGGEGASECLRTFPAREFGGNLDISTLTAGVTLLLPCYVDGCMLSVGDVHFAQGDGEVGGTGIEMNAVVRLRVDIREGQADSLGDRPAFKGNQQLSLTAPRPFYSVVGYPLKDAGEITAQQSGLAGLGLGPPLSYFNQGALAPLTNLSEDLNQAARDALERMIDHMVNDRGLTPEQAIVVASVAVDMRIGNVVDVPNLSVYAVLPEDIFVH
jgi:formamidase